MDFSQTEKNIGYVFKDKELLRRALTLSSYDNNFNNQTLEFFGDAVLELIVTEEIFCADEDEGVLTKKRANIVSDKSLRIVSEKLGLDKVLIRGVNDSNNKKAVPSVYEAVVAAIYLDGGMQKAKKFVLKTLDFNAVSDNGNYIGTLQEILQSESLSVPCYSVRDLGNENKHIYEAKVKVFGEEFNGVAESKKQAKQNAAQSALEYLNGKNE